MDSLRHCARDDVVQTVATGTSGLLLSVGQFDDQPTQVYIGNVDANGVDTGAVSFRFYVNARPGSGSGSAGACPCGG